MNLGEQDNKVSSDDITMDKDRLTSFFGGCDDKNGGVNCDDMYSGGFRGIRLSGLKIFGIMVVTILFLIIINALIGTWTSFGWSLTIMLGLGVCLYLANHYYLDNPGATPFTSQSSNPPPLPERDYVNVPQSEYGRIPSSVGGNYW